MDIDAATFRAIAKRLLPRDRALSADEATAIVQLLQLVIGADLDEVADERQLLPRLTRYVSALGGIDPEGVPPVSPLPLDAEERTIWVQRLARQLVSTGPCELAYVLSYLLAIGDLEVAPVELTLIDELQRALGIDDDRASDLVATVSAMVTPEAEPEAEVELEVEERAPGPR